MLGNRDWSHCLQHPMIVQGLSSSSKLSTKDRILNRADTCEHHEFSAYGANPVSPEVSLHDLES